jgi:transglutaminase-like putative cysteine protease
MGGAAGLAVAFFALQPDVEKVRLAAAPAPAPALEAPETVEHIGAATAAKLAKALTPMDPMTRNAAVKIAARTQGPFHVEQVAEIWSAVRAEWRYVNDPVGEEYFATSSETIQNGYIGDCDDFAITLASMVLSIGGKARVVLMDGPEGGHAYAEACVQDEPTKVATALRKHYRARWKKYLAGRPVPDTIAFRTSEDCPIWLNLDWTSVVPGGAYVAERWAVAIYGDGRSEPLAVVGSVPPTPPTPPEAAPTARPNTRAGAP